MSDFTPDMLVKLFALPSLEEALIPCTRNGVIVRRAYAPEKHAIRAWVEVHFGEVWACEAENAFAEKPPTIHIALRGTAILGFACFDTTFKNYFGPTGVDEHERGTGIGKALMLASLYSLREMGYRYAVVGYAGVPDYYEKVLGAMVIDENPREGSYGGLIV